jgi:hypothetical protein
MSTVNSRLLNKAGVRAIMNKRTTIPTTAVGRKVSLLVQGNGNVIDVTDKDGNPVHSTIKGFEGTILEKKIFNVRANSAMAMQNPRNRQYMIDALKAEAAGEDQKAHDLYNQYLNSCQLSFGIILGSNTGVVDQLANNVQIDAIVQQIDTENGSLITIDPSTISFPKSEVYGVEDFNLDDFIAAAPAAPAPAAKPATGRKTKV